MHYNGTSNYLLVNGTKILKSKAKDLEIAATSLCIGKISKYFSGDNMKKTGLNGYVYYFNIGYDAIGFNDILEI